MAAEVQTADAGYTNRPPIHTQALWRARLETHAGFPVRSTVSVFEGLELREFGIEFALDIGFLQHVALNLAAGGFWYALGRDDLSDLETRVFVYQALDRRGGRQKLRHAAAM